MNDQEISAVFGFRRFPVYKDIRNLRKELKTYSRKNFPKEEQYRLLDQLWRALDSVLLNLAEGSEKFSYKSQSNFYNISITSMAEVVSCVNAGFDDGYIDETFHNWCLAKSAIIMKQLRSLYATIRYKG